MDTSEFIGHDGAVLAVEVDAAALWEVRGSLLLLGHLSISTDMMYDVGLTACASDVHRRSDQSFNPSKSENCEELLIVS